MTTMIGRNDEVEDNGIVAFGVIIKKNRVI